MKIVHFSDPHAGGSAEDWLAYFDKRAVGVFNYRFRRCYQHDMKKLANAVAYILDTKPDVAVCTGDLTSTGQPGEFEVVRPILKPLRDSSIPLLYTPGNHDCYVTRPKCVAAVKEMVFYLSRGAYGFDDMPLVRRIGDCDFLLVNTSYPSNLLCSWGFLKRRERDFLLEACAGEKKSTRILVTHYPMREELPLLRFRHRLFGQKEVVRLLHEKKIDLALCGHVHKPFLRCDDDGRGECCAGSVTRNGEITEIDCSSGRFDYKTVKL